MSVESIVVAACVVAYHLMTYIVIEMLIVRRFDAPPGGFTPRRTPAMNRRDFDAFLETIPVIWVGDPGRHPDKVDWRKEGF